MQLRDYQKEAVDTLFSYWEKSQKPAIIQAATGCFTGDTMVRVNLAHNGRKLSIKSLYNSWNAVQRDGRATHSLCREKAYVRGWRNGRVGLNKIKDVVCVGKRPVVRLEFTDGTVIRCTPDHPFLAKTTHRSRSEPEWVQAKDLLGMVVAKDNPHTKKGDGEHKLRDRYISVPLCYPYGAKHFDKKTQRYFKTVELHRAIYEANLNGFEDVYDWKDAIGKKPLKALDPKKIHIHHKDHNHFNNEPWNLEAIEANEHLKLHSNPQNFHQGTVRYVKCIEIEEGGEETVYDIECDDVHSYTANDFVVHNSGKSVICAEIAKRFNAPVLILQPTKEILEQNYDKLIQAGMPSKYVKICSASAGGWEIGVITFATIGTIYKHSQHCQHFKVCIVDECDVVNIDKASGMYMSFLRQLPRDCKIIGLTASPWRNVTKNKRGCDPEIYCRPLTRIPTAGKKATERFGTWFWGGGVIYKCDIPYLQSRGFLSPTQYYVAETDWSFLSPALHRVDYDTNEMTQWAKFEANASRFHQAVAFCQRHNYKTIVFSPNIIVSGQLKGIILGAGAPAITLDSENDNKAMREEKMRWFREKGCKFLVNVGMVGRGVDVPSVDAIIMCRPTKSLSVYVQAVGRCLRIDPDNPDKVAQILDLSGNVERFGKVEHIRLGKKKEIGHWGEFEKDVIEIAPNGRRKIWERVS